MTIVPFNKDGLRYEAKEIGGKWRIVVYHTGTSTGTLYDSATYTEETAKKIAEIKNKEVAMRGTK